MAVQYTILIKSRAGALLRILTGQAAGYRQLSYSKELNAVGLLIFDLSSGHNAIADLERDGQVEVWRRDLANSIDWYQDFGGFFVDEERQSDDNGNSVFRAYCPDYNDLLGRAVIAWYSNTADRTLFTASKAETILKLLVAFNVVASAATTGNGRWRTTDITSVTIEADTGGGNTITFACAQDELLPALQAVARIGDRDFYLARTGAQAWEFRVKQYLGTDRSTTVVFALNYGNMSSPILRRNRLSEKTVMIVGGQGADTARAFEVRTGTNYNATYNSKEDFYPATEYSTAAGLQAAGDVRLDEVRARDDLTWDINQTPGCLYGVHYFHGDLVIGYYQGVTATKQILKVSVTYAPSNQRPEVIQVETGNL